MLKRCITIFLALPLLLLLSLTTSLAESEEKNSVQPQYTHITSIDGRFDIQNGKAECYGAGRSRYTDTTTIVSVTLQRRVTGTTKWSTICSWNDTKSGKAYAFVDEEKTVSKGYDYRIYIKCTIKDSEGVIKETDGLYSRVITY